MSFSEDAHTIARQGKELATLRQRVEELEREAAKPVLPARLVIGTTGFGKGVALDLVQGCADRLHEELNRMQGLAGAEARKRNAAERKRDAAIEQRDRLAEALERVKNCCACSGCVGDARALLDRIGGGKEPRT